MVVQNVIKRYWHHVLLHAWILYNKQEAEVICLLVKIVVSLGHNAHNLAHSLYLFY